MDMEINQAIDLGRLKRVIEGCCKTEEECGSCAKHRCIIGFGKGAIQYCMAKNLLHISQGPQMIPHNDYKVYDQTKMIRALAETCLQCKSCRESHDEECIVNLLRTSLETAILEENIPYQGSPSIYIMQVGTKSPEVGQRLAEEYRKLREQERSLT